MVHPGARTLLALAAAASTLLPTSHSMAETIKIAYIDPLSGPFAPVGQSMLNHWQFIADMANSQQWAGEHRFEVTGFDNKGSPQESLALLKTAVDQGYRYVTQGVGSSAAVALTEAIKKHNERNPGQELLFLNYASNDPDLTNSKCNYWHFRLDANSDMKIEALTEVLAANPEIKKIYLINQDFSFGHQVARGAKEALQRKRPDIEIVGESLHPSGQVKDFSPYVAKMIQSGAQAVVTGNYGADLALLARAAHDLGLQADFYTIYGSTTGGPRAIGQAGADRVKFVGSWHPNNAGFVGEDIANAYRAKYNDDFIGAATYAGIAMLSKAATNTQSTDPVQIAAALEGITVTSLNGEVTMRASDHQAQQPLYVATWTQVNGQDVKYEQEGTGLGWRTDLRLDADRVMLDTSCEMTRPHS